jgi:hypothetical protein
VERGHPELSIRRQCELLGVNRAGLYYEPVGESEENVLLMRLLDEQYTRAPFYGSRRMTAWLATQGHEVNRKRISRLMQVMGLEAVYPGIAVLGGPVFSEPPDGTAVLLRAAKLGVVAISSDIQVRRPPSCTQLSLIGGDGGFSITEGMQVSR